MAVSEQKKEQLVTSVKEASKILKEKYEFQMVNKMRSPMHPKYHKSWKPDNEDHTYLEGIKNGKLYKIKVFSRSSGENRLKSLVGELDYVLYFNWSSSSFYTTELVLQL